jgi:hypothetical protein
MPITREKARIARAATGTTAGLADPAPNAVVHHRRDATETVVDRVRARIARVEIVREEDRARGGIDRREADAVMIGVTMIVAGTTVRRARPPSRHPRH